MRRLAILSLLLLAACATREVKPTEAEMDRIEAALTGDACAARLIGGDRHYYYRPRYYAEEVEAAKTEGRPPRSSNRVTSVVQFNLVPRLGDRTGTRTSHAVPPQGPGAVDGAVHGAYHLETGELDLAGCTDGATAPAGYRDTP